MNRPTKKNSLQLAGRFRITIHGWFGEGNLGDEIILREEVRALRALLPEAEIAILTRNPAAIPTYLGAKAVNLTDIGSLVSTLLATDLFILGGGGLVMAGGGRPYARMLLLAKFLGARTMTYSLGVEDPLMGPDVPLWRLALNVCDVITVRSRRSREILEKAGINERVYCTSDPAFALGAVATAAGPAEAPPLGKPYIAVSMRGLDKHSSTPAPSHRDLLQMVSTAIDALVTTHRLGFVLVPMQTSGDGSDIPVLHELRDMCSKRNSVYVIEKSLSTEEICALLSNAEASIGMRLHFLILSACVRTPPVAIASYQKLEDIMEALGMEKSVMQIGDMSAERIIAMLESTLTTKSLFSARIERTLLELSEDAKFPASLASNILRNQRHGGGPASNLQNGDLAGSELRKLELHFDTIAKAYYDIVDSVWYEHGYFHKREVQFLRESIDPKVPIAVDAGCGPGRLSEILAGVAERVVAVDISREMLKLARIATANSPSHVDLIQADVRRLPLKAGSTSLAVSVEVLEHLPGGRDGVVAALRELRRILTPGGKLVTEVPLRRHTYVNHLWPPSMRELRSAVVRSYYRRAPLPIEEYQNDKEIENRAERAGFIIKTKAFVRVLPSGIVERFPAFVKADAVLERIPLVRRLAREVIWLFQAV